MGRKERRRKHMEDVVATAICRGLKRRHAHAYVEQPRRGFKTAVDGEFYMMAVARQVLAEMRRSGLLIDTREGVENLVPDRRQL